jgi:hypothetical protein
MRLCWCVTCVCDDYTCNLDLLVSWQIWRLMYTDFEKHWNKQGVTDETKIKKYWDSLADTMQVVPDDTVLEKQVLGAKDNELVRITLHHWFWSTHAPTVFVHAVFMLS